MPPIISKIIPLKGGFPKGGIKSGPRNPPRGRDYKQSPPYRGIFTCIYFLQCKVQPPSAGVHHPSIYAILLTPEWEECICATSTPLQRLAEEARAQQAHPSGSAILECYKGFTDVFSEEAFTHLPLQSMGPHHRAPPQCQTPQRED